jgi:hypothetical protein
MVRRSQMRSRRSVALTLLGAFLLLLTAASQAQDGPYIPPTFQPKSEDKALRYSLFGTVAPVTAGIALACDDQLTMPGLLLVASGIMVGPSLGYYYGSCGGRGGKGIAVRLGLSALTYGLGAFFYYTTDYSGSGVEDVTPGVLVAGSAAVTIHAICDIAKVKSTVRKHNEKIQARSLGIVPTYSPDSDAPGLALQLTF